MQMPKKRKTSRELNQDLIEVKISLGTDMTGKRIQKSFYGRTKSEAREKAEDYKIKIATGETAIKSNSNMTFSEWAEKWIKTYKEKNIKSSTYKIKYESFLETHLKPYFENVKISKISQIDIQNFINSKSDFNKDTQKRYVNLLKSIFESAVENDLINKNPVKNISLKSENTKKEKRTYKQSEVDKIIDFAKNHRYGGAVAVLLKTGLRRGELLALKWEDIDFENKIVNVKRAVADIPVNGILKPVISENSNETKNHNRQIPFIGNIEEILQGIEKKSEFIFPNIKGEINSPNNYSKCQYAYFMNDLKKEYPEINKLSVHELRHTFGTLLYEKKIDLRIIQKIMGHADLKTTSEIYIHDNIDYIKTELEKIN
jgi:integrase